MLVCEFTVSGAKGKDAVKGIETDTKIKDSYTSFRHQSKPIKINFLIFEVLVNALQNHI